MKIQVNKQNVGLRIKQLRLDKGYTLEEFGKIFDTGKSNIQFWENGRSLPNKERIKAIAKLGDMSVNELLYGSVGEFISENYFQLDDKYKNLNKEELEEIKKSKNRIVIMNTILNLIRYLQEQEITVNDIDKLIAIADNEINLKSRILIAISNDKKKLGENFVQSLDFIKSEHGIELLTFYSNILDSYELNTEQKEIINSILESLGEMYIDSDIINND
ncbi:MAG: helix-turn-helix domain-containing protein [Gemella sp.]|nr:helix-turn-helix domain-containing protein [Gemella sp.]